MPIRGDFEEAGRWEGVFADEEVSGELLRDDCTGVLRFGCRKVSLAVPEMSCTPSL